MHKFLYRPLTHTRSIMSKAFIVPTTHVKDSHPLINHLPPSSKTPKVGTTHIFYDQPKGALTALTSLGDNYDNKSNDEKSERVRRAIGSAVRDIRNMADGISELEVDLSTDVDPSAAAIAAYLARYRFTLKTSPPSPFNPNLGEPLPEKLTLKPSQPSKEWDTGIIYAEAQNLARTLVELPANMCTPTAFTERVKKEFFNIPNVEIRVHDEEWAAEKGMRTFLSVTQGTSEPAKFLEIIYSGGAPDIPPVAFVGKGITFDSGGISLKPSLDMKLMRGDMGGAAAVVSALRAIAQLGVPINVVAVTPLCENLPGPSATKPGDIIYAMNGKTVEVDNTDAEGRLVLSDAIYYVSTEYQPQTVIDVATLTGAMGIALGEVFSGVFTTSDALWKELHEAGESQYDRFWRMPLDEDFMALITGSNADLCNIGGRDAGSCTAAMFLKAFVPETLHEGRWAHIDIAGSMDTTRPGPYQEKGMTGRPVRALIEWARRLAA